MVGNIICPVQFGSGGFNPDDYFDPTTHVATEANFIKLLEDGIYDRSLIGYKVQLGTNGGEYHNGIWVIADVDHDSENTGQTNCYDLISVNCFYNNSYASYSSSWRNSVPRSWLNNTFYGGFSSNFKARMLNPKYKSESIWYTDDYVIIPSYKEINGGTSTSQDNEGVAYPIFTDDNSRIKSQHGSANAWWTRSRYNLDTSSIWFVLTNGSMSTAYYYYSYCIAPLIRVQ